MAKRVTPESALKKAAKDFLQYHHVFTFPLTAGMGSHPGAPDRIGIYKGKPLAIEFKSPKGKLTIYQKAFKVAWELEKGIYIECRSIKDLAMGLNISTLGIL